MHSSSFSFALRADRADVRSSSSCDERYEDIDHAVDQPYLRVHIVEDPVVCTGLIADR